MNQIFNTNTRQKNQKFSQIKIKQKIGEPKGCINYVNVIVLFIKILLNYNRN